MNFRGFRKILIALLLIVLMILTILPSVVFAEEVSSAVTSKGTALTVITKILDDSVISSGAVDLYEGVTTVGQLKENLNKDEGAVWFFRNKIDWDKSDEDTLAAGDYLVVKVPKEGMSGVYKDGYNRYYIYLKTPISSKITVKDEYEECIEANESFFSPGEYYIKTKSNMFDKPDPMITPFTTVSELKSYLKREDSKAKWNVVKTKAGRPKLEEELLQDGDILSVKGTDVTDYYIELMYEHLIYSGVYNIEYETSIKSGSCKITEATTVGELKSHLMIKEGSTEKPTTVNVCRDGSALLDDDLLADGDKLEVEGQLSSPPWSGFPPEDKCEKYTINVLKVATISFNVNEGTGTAPESITVILGEDSKALPDGKAITAPADMVFSGWNTKSDGCGTNYNGGENINVTEDLDIELFAKWEIKPKYMVSYDENGKTAGDVPKDSNAYEEGVDVIVLGKGTLERTGYTFAGWNTQADGEGKKYKEKDTFKIGKDNVTLYANWKIEEDEDVDAPMIKVFNPKNKAINVAINTNLEITFDENIKLGSGNITIHKAVDDSVVETVSVEDSNVSINKLKVSINLNKELKNSTEYYIYIEEGCFKDEAGNEYAGINDKNIWSFTTILKKSDSGNSGSGSSSGGGGGIHSGKKTNGLVEVNGKKLESSNEIKTQIKNGQEITTVKVNQEVLEQKLEKEGKEAIVTIPVENQKGLVIGELNGHMVKSMEQEEAVLEIKTQSAKYTLPAKQISIDEISKKLGKKVELKDIKVNVAIGEPTREKVKLVEDTCEKGYFTLVVPPVNFTVKCSYDNKQIEVKRFSNYVERTIEIPEGVDPNKITTGVVVNPDGTTYHVPTYVKVVDGKYYAVINSLTNSTYTVVWHPIEFKDVEKHWAKEAVNNMGSRMVVNGAGNDMYLPNNDVTRAEFAAIMVRALGLKAGIGENKFGDVTASDWYCDYVETATNYNVIKGYDNGNFGPNDKITREQAMTMIARAMTLTKLESNLTEGESATLINSFVDGSTSATYAKDNIAACLKTGVVFGKNGNVIAPKDNITRAEVAVIVERLLQKSELIDK